jgi:hypothetical protein
MERHHVGGVWGVGDEERLCVGRVGDNERLHVGGIGDEERQHVGREYETGRR